MAAGTIDSGSRKSILILVNIQRLVGSEFSVLMGDLDRQSPKLSLSQPPFPLRLWPEALKNSRIAWCSFRRFSGCEHTGSGWMESKQDREKRGATKSSYTRGKGHVVDAMAVPAAQEESPVSMNQNQSSAHLLEGSPRAKYYCRLFTHAAWCASRRGSVTQALSWLEKWETWGWRD